MQGKTSRDACQLPAFFEKTNALATVGRNAKTQVLKNVKKIQFSRARRKIPAWAAMSVYMSFRGKVSHENCLNFESIYSL